MRNRIFNKIVFVISVLVCFCFSQAFAANHITEAQKSDDVGNKLFISCSENDFLGTQEKVFYSGELKDGVPQEQENLEGSQT